MSRCSRRLSPLVLVALSACNTTQAGRGGARNDSRVMDADGAGASEGGAFPVQPTSEMNVVATYDGVSGDWMCIGYGSLWEPSGGKLVRIDPEQHTVLAKIPVSGNFCAASPDGKHMWVASVYEGKLHRIDQATNTVDATFDVAITSGSEGSFAVTEDGVWVVTSNGGTTSGTLTKVDPVTGQIVADVKVENDSHGVVAEGGSIWVTSYSGNSVTQVDAQQATVVKTIAVDKGPRFISGGEGGVWTLCQGTGNVAHIDPATGTVVATIEAKVPGGGGDISAGEGSVWVTTFGKPVTRIDPKTNTAVVAYQGGGFGDAIRAGAGYVWVSGGHLSQIKFPPLAGM